MFMRLSLKRTGGRLGLFLLLGMLVAGIWGTGLVRRLPTRSALAVSPASTPANNTLYAWGDNRTGQLGDGSVVEEHNPELVSLPGGVTPTAAIARNNYSLAIGSDGNLYAWGGNNFGQLGDGSTTDKHSPEIVNLPGGAMPIAIAAGERHSLAIGSDGNLYAWGSNEYGQLGDGSTTNQTTPISISLPGGVKPTAIAAGYLHSMAIGSDGNLYVWGNNTTGQLGDGSTDDKHSPEVINLPGTAMPTAIAASYSNSMAIGNDGKLYSWGNNGWGQVGDGSITDRHSPVVVNLAVGVSPTAIAVSYADNLALGSDGKVYAWGYNQNGQLGDGSTTDKHSPGIVNLPVGVIPTKIVAGYAHNLVIGNDGKLYAWGDNSNGQLGDGSIVDKHSPVVVNLPAGLTPTTITAADLHNLAILTPSFPSITINNVTHIEGNSSTTPYTFTVSLSYATSQTVTVNYVTADGTATVADNDYQPITGTLSIPPNQLTGTVTVMVSGDNNYEPNETFTLNLSNPTNATLDTISHGTGVIINDDRLSPVSNGSFYAWGYNGSGELGDGSTNNSSIPVTVNLPPGVNATAIASGNSHSLAIGSDGNLYAWGYNNYGQLGNGTRINTSTPVTVSLPPGVRATAISAGQYHSMAIGSDGNLYDWGWNQFGQLGNGSTVVYSSTPVTVSLPAGVRAISICDGENYSLAIGSDGNLYEWGYNQYGQLGDGTTATATTPVISHLPGGVSPTSIAAGYDHTLAIGSDGKLYAWGNNTNGQLGNGTLTDSHLPVVVNLPGGVIPTAIATGAFYSLASGSDGNLYGWGVNQYGQLGTGAADNNPHPLPLVVNMPANVKPAIIAAGGYHSLAIGSDGKLYTWGYNKYGQLGNGSTNDSATPLPITGLGSFTIPALIEGGDFNTLSVFLPPPTLTISNVNQLEGNTGSTSFQFPVSLSYATAQTVTVKYATADGTATIADNDYQPISGTLTITPGQITGTITVLVNGDTKYEPDETFTLILSSPTGVVLGSSSVATGAILNDDTACNPLLVTTTGDDGSCGTLRAALAFASSNPTKTVSINLTAGSVISLTTALTLTNGVSITTTAPCGVGTGNTMLPPVTILGTGANSGNGLTLAGHNRLYGLWVRGFSGVQIKAPVGSSTKMQCVRASKL